MEKIRRTEFQKQENSGRNGLPAVDSQRITPKNSPAV